MIWIAKFYITTPIYYVNGKPHLGHAYTSVVADVIARWHRLRGDNVFFLGGTDEHGEKIIEAAAKAKKTPQEFVDGIVETFHSAWSKLNISFDHFERTTDKDHEAAVAQFVRKLIASGDVYKGEYAGWYCVPDETFWTDLQLVDGKCPECGREVKWIKEESYFFRLSKYQDRLLDFYKAHPEYISPQFRASEMINRVKTGLKDLSITRTSVKWAVPYPGDDKHFLYVWIDALICYVSALGWPGGTFSKMWPADLHIVGKEISWFHCVIWPALLFSAGIEPAKKVFIHGHWMVDGKKMSKSLGNVLDPLDIANKYSVDALRYCLLKDMQLGGDDGNFTEKSLVARINGELVADLGNLVYRVISLAERFEGKIEGKPELDAELHVGEIDKAIEEVNPNLALEKAWEFVRKSNKYVNDKKVWTLKGEEMANSLYNLLESCRIIAILISPFLPETAESICSQLGVKLGSLEDCKFGSFEGKVCKGAYLFKKVDVEGQAGKA